MFRTLLTASAAAVALSSASFAGEGDFTLSGGYSFVSIDDVIDIDIGAISLRGGYDFTDHFGVEGQVDIGVDDENIAGVDLGLNYAASIFGVARAPLSENVSIFARLGYSTAELESNAAGVSGDGDGIAFGVGGEFLFDGVNGIRLDYTRHELDDVDADVFGISYVRRFSTR